MTDERTQGEDTGLEPRDDGSAGVTQEPAQSPPAAGDEAGEGTALQPGELATEEGAPAEAEPAEEAAPLPPEELRKAVEALLFSASEPVMVRTLSEILGRSVHEVREAIEELRLEYIDTGRAFRIEDIAGGVQLLTVKEYDPWIRKLHRKEREGRLSPASMETLSVIAYKQPITRSGLESIRGVTCGPTLKTLLDRGLVKIVGRSEALGRPLLYGTTRRFLESFGISSVRELPQPELEMKMEALAASLKPPAEAAPLFEEGTAGGEPAAGSGASALPLQPPSGEGEPAPGESGVSGEAPPEAEPPRAEDELYEDAEDDEEDADDAEDDEDDEDEEDAEEDEEEDEEEHQPEEDAEDAQPSEEFSTESPPGEKA